MYILYNLGFLCIYLMYDERVIFFYIDYFGVKERVSVFTLMSRFVIFFVIF